MSRRASLVLLACTGTGAAGLAVAPTASADRPRCPLGAPATTAAPAPLDPSASTLAGRGRSGAFVRRTAGGRVVLCEDVQRAATGPRRLRLIATLDRVGARDAVPLVAFQGRDRVAWWVDRPGGADRIRERRVGRRATRARSVPARYAGPRSAGGFAHPETLLAVGLDGTLAWVRRDGDARELRRSRPGRASGVAARWRDPEGFDRLERWGSRALVVPAAGDRVVALDASGGRCAPGGRRLLRGGRLSVTLAPEVTGTREDSVARRRIGACDAAGRVRVAPVAGASENSGGGGCSYQALVQRARRVVLLGEVLLVETSATVSSAGGLDAARWATTVHDARTRTRLPGAAGWTARPGEAPPGPVVPGREPMSTDPGARGHGTDPQDPDRLLVGGGVALWRAARFEDGGTVRVDEVHAVDADGPRVLDQRRGAATGPNQLSGLRLEGTTARWSTPDGERSAVLGGGTPVEDTGRQDALVPAPGR